MSKLPVSASPHSKPNTTSSAWTRLVQTTKTASKTSRHGDAKPPVRKQFSAANTSSMAEASRPIKRRRITGPLSRSALKSAPKLSPAASPRQVADHDQNLACIQVTQPAPIAQSVRAGSEHTQVYPTTGKGPLLQEGEYNLPPSSKRQSASLSVPSSPPTHADLRTFWGPCAEGKKPEKERALEEGHELKFEDAGREGTAAESAGNRRTLDLVCEGSGLDVEDELPRQLPEKALEHDETSRPAQQDISDIDDIVATMPTCSPSTDDFQATSEKAVPPRAISSSLRSGPRIRRRVKFEHETGRLDHGQEDIGQGSTAEEELNTAADSESKVPHASSSTPIPGLHERTTDSSINRGPEPIHLTTSTFSTSSLTDQKENAAPTRKPKRRLTLHDTQHQHQQQPRKRKPAPKQTVQTTLALAIGGSAGMRECKVCDTVYNPYHPEDVKVHAKRHAGVVRKGRISLEL